MFTRRPRAAMPRTVLLCGAAMLALAAAQKALGQAAAAPATASQPTGADDGLKGGGFYLEADLLINDDAAHTVTAKGSVEARYKGRIVRADELAYDRDTGVVTARGHVRILNADGTSQFAQAIVLDKDMTEGVAVGFSSRLGGNVKMAAAGVERRTDQITELNRAVFTPCPICADNNGGSPTWSIRAKNVIENKKKQSLYFRDAVIEVKGVPILYLPVFLSAEPAADRRSGFLLPFPTFSGSRGFSLEQPYYQVISKSQDITITPQINTKVNPFLNIDWRARFYSGQIDVRAGYTYDYDFMSNGDKFGSLTSRSYILADGLFNLSQTWYWGFTAEQSSDKLLFDKYSINNVYEDRGLYAADSQRLISQLFAVRQDQNSYLSVAAIEIQGLRATDDQSTFPTVAPLIEAHYEPDRQFFGGRLRLDASAVALTSDRSQFTPGLPGEDSRRATAEADWQRSFTLPDGIRLTPFVWGRTDLYSVSNFDSTESTAIIPRAFGTLGMDVDWPFIKRTNGATWILEPLVQLAVSPNPTIDSRIPDYDSVDFDLDEINLFQADKSPGYDLFDGGQKVNLGGRATVLLDDGRSASILVGRSFRFEPAPGLPAYSGVAGALSDYVIAAEATPIAGVRLFSSWRLDSDTLHINRLEAGALFATGPVNGYVSYLQEALSPSGGPVGSLDIHGEAFATKHWGVTFYGIRDFDAGEFRNVDAGIIYRDDCVRIEVLYRRNYTTNGTFGPSNSVVLRLSLATLGNSGYSRPTESEPPLF